MVGILTKHQSPLTTAWHEQIPDGFVVYLEVRERHFGVLVIFSFAYPLKQLLHGQEDDARLLCGTTSFVNIQTTIGLGCHSRDGVCFAAAGRAVRKNSGIITVEHAIEESSGRCLVHIGLRDILIKDPIEAKGLVLDPLS